MRGIENGGFYLENPESDKDKEYYNRLKQLVDQGRVLVKLIIGPTRSASTLMEECLSKSPDIDYKCHEPLLAYNADGPIINPSGYQLIYERIGGEIFEKSGQQATILIKDITYWLYNSGEYKKLFDLAQDPILFLIRNPFITMESRMRKVAESLPSNLDQLTKRAILSLCGHEGDEGLSDEGVFALYANMQGFLSWEELLAHSFANHDYHSIGKVLEVSESWFNVDAWGSNSLEGQIAYLEGLRRSVILIDSTTFRLNAQAAAQAICSQWAIEYQDEMIYWGKGNLKLDERADSIWFTRIASSSGVEPPTEIPLLLAELPEFIQKQLLQKDLPAYARLMRHPAMIANHSIGDITFEMPLNDQNLSRLLELGIINESDPQPRVTIQDVDPIFAVCKNPQLLNDASYLNRKRAYQDIFNIIRES
ncbi:MAG: hypothetical protein ABI425_04215 [Patescibacteria group bacterium]